MQKTSRLTKCATTGGSWPRACNVWATAAKAAAARSVRARRVSPGRSRSGSEKAHFSRSRTARSARSSRSKLWVRLTLFVQLVRMRNRSMAQNQSSRHGPPSGGPDFQRPSNRAPATRVGVSKSLLGRCLCGFEASRTRRASTTSARRDRARPGVVSCSRFSSGATRNGEMRRQIGW